MRTGFFLSCFLVLLFPVSPTNAITPEQVLGEYWKDPLFGAAAADHTLNVEILVEKIWPETLSAPLHKNTRFVFENKTAEPHLLVFTRAAKKVLEDESFQKFAADELYHSQQKQAHSAGHHSHAGSSTDDAQSIVKTMDQRPTVFVESGDRKEILIHFMSEEPIEIFCALDAHREAGYSSDLTLFSVLSAEQGRSWGLPANRELP